MAYSGIPVDKAVVSERIKMFHKEKKIRSVTMQFNKPSNPTSVTAEDLSKEVDALPLGRMDSSDGILKKINLESCSFAYFLLNCRLSTTPETDSDGKETFADYAVLIKWSDDDRVKVTTKMTGASTWGVVKSYVSKQYGKTAILEINSMSDFNNKVLLDEIKDTYKPVGRIVSFEGCPINEL